MALSAWHREEQPSLRGNCKGASQQPQGSLGLSRAALSQGSSQQPGQRAGRWGWPQPKEMPYMACGRQQWSVADSTGMRQMVRACDR